MHFFMAQLASCFTLANTAFVAILAQANVGWPNFADWPPYAFAFFVSLLTDLFYVYRSLRAGRDFPKYASSWLFWLLVIPKAVLAAAIAVATKTTDPLFGAFIGVGLPNIIERWSKTEGDLNHPPSMQKQQ
jgi:hypothetical protein